VGVGATDAVAVGKDVAVGSGKGVGVDEQAIVTSRSPTDSKSFVSTGRYPNIGAPPASILPQNRLPVTHEFPSLRGRGLTTGRTIDMIKL
jgi:hypothetical protein